MNTKFVKIINNRKVIKYRKNIVIDSVQNKIHPITQEPYEVKNKIVNPTNEMLFADGWELYVKPEPTAEELFNEAKRRKINTINIYDASQNVNIFYIQGLPIWLDKATRAGLKLRFEAELALKKESTTLWYNNKSFTLPLNSAMQMLYALEVYASECYDNTQLHLANVDKLTSIEELDKYDYTIGYPDKLIF